MDYKPNWNIESIPEELILSRAGRIMAARRATPGGFRPGAGRKPKYVPCPRCGELVTTTEARAGHGCQAKKKKTGA